MPHNLNNFVELIRTIPVKEHSVTVNATDWQNRFGENRQNIHQAIFENNPTLEITRHRLLNHHYENPELKCAEILLWGYPTNLHGRATHLFPYLEQIAVHAAADGTWPNYFNNFHGITGIRISTITKLAYFHNRVFNGHTALILDSRIRKNTSRWNDFNDLELAYHNAQDHYLSYLKLMSQISQRLVCQPDQLELFLFLFGGCLSDPLPP